MKRTTKINKSLMLNESRWIIFHDSQNEPFLIICHNGEMSNIFQYIMFAKRTAKIDKSQYENDSNRPTYHYHRENLNC